MVSLGLPQLAFLLQLADSAFPVGAFTLSHGLEAAVQEGLVGDGEGLAAWATGFLRGAVACLDGLALAGAHRAAGRGDVGEIVAIDRTLHAARLATESREASVRMGRHLLRLGSRFAGGAAFDGLRASVAQGRAHGHHAVVLGVLTGVAGVPVQAALAAALYSTAACVMGAALRLMRLGHEEAQAILYGLREEIDSLSRQCAGRDWREMGSSAPLADILSMRHERASVRLFAS